MQCVQWNVQCVQWVLETEIAIFLCIVLKKKKSERNTPCANSCCNYQCIDVECIVDFIVLKNSLFHFFFLRGKKKFFTKKSIWIKHYGSPKVGLSKTRRQPLVARRRPRVATHYTHYTHYTLTIRNYNRITLYNLPVLRSC